MGKYSIKSVRQQVAKEIQEEKEKLKQANMTILLQAVKRL